MQKIFILIIPLFILGAESLRAQDASVNQLSSNDFQELLLTNSGVLLDVRTAGEFENGHIPASGNLNYYALDFKRKLKLLSKEEPIYLYCNSGYRSERAARYLIDHGYSQVYNLEKGIIEWDAEDFPLIVEPHAKPDTKDMMDENTLSVILESEPIVFVDFYAPWCGPCRKMMPMIDSLQVDYKSKILVLKVNTDASRSLVKGLKIPSVPYLTLYKNGELIFSHKGLIGRKELVDEFEKLN